MRPHPLASRALAAAAAILITTVLFQSVALEARPSTAALAVAAASHLAERTSTR